MFTLAKLIPNDGTPSLINEVCFDPDGRSFAAAYEYSDELRLYDTQSLSLIRVFRNPEARLNRPHGILLTRKHLIVANKGASPCDFRIFRLDDDSGAPVHNYTTPWAHLAEGHSIALNGRRLVVTYCEGLGKQGALVSYDYDDESGRIIGPLDMQDRWFLSHGDAKGVSFDGTGDRVYVTFQSDLMTWRRKLLKRIKNAVSFGTRGGASHNGLVIFGIDRQGRFTRRPLWRKISRRFCRLENIDVRAEHAVVTDPDSGCVRLYDLRADADFETPVQEIRDPLFFPHGAKFSPDGKLLVVCDNGIETLNHQPQWRTFATPRKDGIVVFTLQPA